MNARVLALIIASSGWILGCADGSTRHDLASPPPASRPPAETDPGPLRRLEEVERRIFELSNHERRRRGLSALRAESTLAEIARRHGTDMLERGYFSHESPEGEDAHDRIAARHRRLIGLTGENIWSGSGYGADDPDALAREIVDDWMSSRGHRENVLRPEYTHLGVGVVAVGSEIRATQNFALARAYLERPLPESARSGAELDLRSSPYGDTSPAELFDLWSVRRQRAATEPTPLDAPRLEAAPGAYSLRFYFPEGPPGSYEIYSGPRIDVR